MKIKNKSLLIRFILRDKICPICFLYLFIPIFQEDYLLLSQYILSVFIKILWLCFNVASFCKLDSLVLFLSIGSCCSTLETWSIPVSYLILMWLLHVEVFSYIYLDLFHEQQHEIETTTCSTHKISFVYFSFVIKLYYIIITIYFGVQCFLFEILLLYSIG